MFVIQYVLAENMFSLPSVKLLHTLQLFLVIHLIVLLCNTSHLILRQHVINSFHSHGVKQTNIQFKY